VCASGSEVPIFLLTARGGDLIYKMGRGQYTLEISASHTLMKIYRMMPLLAWSVSMDSTFKSII
jgi:hypothetical protein